MPSREGFVIASFVRTMLSIAMFSGAGIAAAPHAQAAGVTVSISCSSLGVEAELCRTGAEKWAEATGNQVRLVPTPSDANERFALYVTLLASGSADIDIFQIDLVWPGILSRHFADLSEYMPADAQGDFAEVLVRNATVEGRLVAVPWFVDAGLLYYRKDLLEAHGRPVPKTWREMAETARIVMDAERQAGRGGMQGYVWQGRAYEGLTCNALEWIASYGGGAIVDEEGRVTIDNPGASAALTEAASWIGSVSPPGVLSYGEEEARGVFQSGNAVFMRNWPYAWALAQADDSPVRDKVGIAPLPAGEGEGARSASVLGGQQLAVSAKSAHPREAAELVLYLTGAEEQKRRAMEGGFNPTRLALYDDQEMIGANPFLADFRTVLESAVARPAGVTGRRYNQVSSNVFQTVHDTLSGHGNPREGLVSLGAILERVSRDGSWR